MTQWVVGSIRLRCMPQCQRLIKIRRRAPPPLLGHFLNVNPSHACSTDPGSPTFPANDVLRLEPTSPGATALATNGRISLLRLPRSLTANGTLPILFADPARPQTPPDSCGSGLHTSPSSGWQPHRFMFSTPVGNSPLVLAA